MAGNGNTNRFYVVRVNRNDARIEEIKAEGDSVLAIEPMAVEGVYEFTTQAPSTIIENLGF